MSLIKHRLAWTNRVLSSFWRERMVRGKYALCMYIGGGSGAFLPPPQESVSVPLSKHNYSSMFTGRQEFFTIVRKLECLQGKTPLTHIL